MASLTFPNALKPLAEHFTIESCNKETCVIKAGKETISLPIGQAVAAAAAFQQMSGLKSSAARFGNSSGFTLKSAENIGNGLVKLGKIDGRLAALALDKIAHTGIAAVAAQVVEAKGGK